MEGRERLNRVVATARKDRALARDLNALAKLDAILTPQGMISMNDPSLHPGSPEFSEMTAKYSALCDRVSARLVDPDGDVDEFGVWLSFHIQEIVRLLRRRSCWWPF